MYSLLQIFARNFSDTQESTGNPADWNNWPGISNGDCTATPVTCVGHTAEPRMKPRPQEKRRNWWGLVHWWKVRQRWTSRCLKMSMQTATSVNWEDAGVVGWAGRTVEKRWETSSASFATSVSKKWGGSTLSNGIPCDEEACGMATEEGERTAPDPFTCTRVGSKRVTCGWACLYTVPWTGGRKPPRMLTMRASFSLRSRHASQIWKLVEICLTG